MLLLYNRILILFFLWICKGYLDNFLALYRFDYRFLLSALSRHCRL